MANICIFCNFSKVFSQVFCNFSKKYGTFAGRPKFADVTRNEKSGHTDD